VCNRISRLNEGPITNESLRAIYREVMSSALSLQKSMAIAYLGPEATLERGYSITRDARGKVIRRVAEAKPRTQVKTRVRDGEFESTVN
jgi:exonuclease VII large subunit